MHKDATLLNGVEGQSVHSLRSKAAQAELNGRRAQQQPTAIYTGLVGRTTAIVTTLPISNLSVYLSTYLPTYLPISESTHLFIIYLTASASMRYTARRDVAEQTKAVTT